MPLVDRVIAELGGRGYPARLVSLGRLGEARDQIQALLREGLLSEEFSEDRLSGFSFEPPSEAQSVMLVAAPSPQAMIVFRRGGTRHEVAVPPTYLHHKEVDQQIEKEVNQVLGAFDHAATNARVPEKLMAVRSGLGLYGRNNICYVPGSGSYTQLAGLFTDIPCSRDDWRQPAAMERCGKCTACEEACPTGAIEPGRFLIRAQKCLTYINEDTSDFPDWVDHSWHNCLVGCMRCQWVCPENRGVRDFVTSGGQFTEEETEAILQEPTSLPHGVAAKMESIGMLYLSELIPRNLQALMDQTG